jgi:hypothetical protein
MIEYLNIANSKVRDRELRRAAEIERLRRRDVDAEVPRPAEGVKPASQAVVIRPAHPEDEMAVRRLAQLEGRPQPGASAVLLAELEGEVLAALPLGGGRAIADPFRPTAELVAMLKLRAAQLRPAEPAEGGRLQRGWRALRAAVSRPVIGPMAGDVSLRIRHDGE